MRPLIIIILLMLFAFAQSYNFKTMPKNQWVSISTNPYNTRGSWTGCAVDTRRGQLMIFGNSFFGGYCGNDVHIYNPDTDQWRRSYQPDDTFYYITVNKKGEGPPYPDPYKYAGFYSITTKTGHPWPRHSYDQICYDHFHDRLVIFSGATGTMPAGGCSQADMGRIRHMYPDIWGFSPLGNCWTFYNPEGNLEAREPPNTPKAKFGAAMAYDSHNHYVWLFGGQHAALGGSGSRVTWYFDITTKKWTELLPAPAPPGDLHHSMCYDPGNKQLLAYIRTGELWTLDVTSPTQWVKRASGPSSSGSGNAIAFDAAAKRAVVVEPSTKTWNPVSNSWSNVTSGLDVDWSMAYDPVHNVTFAVTNGMRVYALKLVDDPPGIGIDTTGQIKECEVVGEVEEEIEKYSNVPGIQVQPNPFNSSINIQIDCRLKIVDCRLKIYNANGVLVKNLTSKIKNQITWNASSQPAGIYILKLKTGSNVLTKRIFVVR